MLLGELADHIYDPVSSLVFRGNPRLAKIDGVNACSSLLYCRHFSYQPTFTSDLRHSLRLGLVLIFLLVLMTTHVGTGLFCLVRFISLFLRDVFFRAAI